jgi:hypothetical protein
MNKVLFRRDKAFMTSLHELKDLSYAKEYPSFFSSLHKQKNLVDIQGINSLTRP